MLKYLIWCQELMKQFIEWHETCKYECKFGENVCNNKQHWNKNKCRCEFKELIHKRVCDMES